MDSVARVLETLPRACRAILRRMQLEGPTTKADLLRIPGMTMTSLNRFLRHLEEQGFVQEEGYAASSGGRRPTLFRLRRDRPYLLGIDISRTYTQIVVTNMGLETLGKRQFQMDGSATPERVIARIADLVGEMFRDLGASPAGLIGAGVGAVGPMDSVKGILRNPANFPAPGWESVPLKSMIQDALGIPAVVRNGAVCAAFGEHLFGSGHGSISVSYINCGVGIRAGYAAAGTAITPMDSADDAFAHMVIDFDGKACACGNVGCVEQYCSIRSISEQYALAAGDPKDTPYQAICAAAAAGETAALQAITAAATAFGWGLANYVNLLGPQLLILSGPLIRCSDLFYLVAVDIAGSKQSQKQYGTTQFLKDGFFGENAIACGAAAIAIDYFLNPIAYSEERLYGF